MKKSLLFSILISLSGIINAQVTTIYHPEIITLTLERVSATLKSLPSIPLTQKDIDSHRIERDNPSLEHEMAVTNFNARPTGADPALQKIKTTRDSSTAIDVLSNWEGLAANVEPSDNCLAVGPNHVFQMTNNSNSTYIRIWDKSGNVLVNNTKVSAISGLSDFGDPNVVYDPIADRYIFLVLGTGTKLEVCISQTEDPTGSYYVYTFNATGGFPDYPKIAVWGDSYFITTNSNSPTIWALNRSQMIDGLPLGSVQKFPLSAFPTIGFQAASPVTFTGTMMPDQGSPALMIRVADDAWGSSIDSDHLEIFSVNIDWVDSSLSSISGPFNLSTPDYDSYMCGFNSLNCIKQPSTNTKLDPLGNMIMDKVQYRRFDDHESFVCSHVVNVDGNGLAGVRWYEIRKENGGSWQVYQRSTYSLDANNRWMSSISLNGDGSIALGYNVSNATTYPGARIVGRSSCDELNLMTSDETVAVTGSASNNSNRYGDYNGMVSDPVDGSFWFTANYNPTSSWSTNVTHFTLSSCVATNVEVASSFAHNLTVIPVPAADQIQVSVVSEITEDAPMQVIDVTGKIVLSQTLHLTPGLTKVTIDVHELSDNLYLLKLQSSSGMAKQKIIIQH